MADETLPSGLNVLRAPSMALRQHFAGFYIFAQRQQIGRATVYENEIRRVPGFGRASCFRRQHLAPVRAIDTDRGEYLNTLCDVIDHAVAGQRTNRWRKRWDEWR
jgi:hypothetical protein